MVLFNRNLVFAVFLRMLAQFSTGQSLQVKRAVGEIMM